MHCNHLPSPGPCKVFELGIDRANEVELLVEQALAAIGLSETFPHALLMLQDTKIQVAGDANVKRACMAAENLDVGAGHRKMLASSWFSAPGKHRYGPGG